MHEEILCVLVGAIWGATALFGLLSFINWQENPDSTIAYQRLIKMVALFGVASSILILHASYHHH